MVLCSSWLEHGWSSTPRLKFRRSSTLALNILEFPKFSPVFPSVFSKNSKKESTFEIENYKISQIKYSLVAENESVMRIIKKTQIILAG